MVKTYLESCSDNGMLQNLFTHFIYGYVFVILMTHIKDFAYTKYMSYSDWKLYHELVGKNVLVFDTKTTGFPKHTKKNKSPETRYSDYSNNDDYDDSRIIQIGWIYIKNFSLEDVSIDKIKCKTVLPVNFSMKGRDVRTKIHGLTNFMEIWMRWREFEL